MHKYSFFLIPFIPIYTIAMAEYLQFYSSGYTPFGCNFNSSTVIKPSTAFVSFAMVMWILSLFFLYLWKQLQHLSRQSLSYEEHRYSLQFPSMRRFQLINYFFCLGTCSSQYKQWIKYCHYTITCKRREEENWKYTWTTYIKMVSKNMSESHKCQHTRSRRMYRNRITQ